MRMGELLALMSGTDGPLITIKGVFEAFIGLEVEKLTAGFHVPWTFDCTYELDVQTNPPIMSFIF